MQVHHIFPHLKGCVGEVLAVPTIQHSRMDIVRMGAEVEEEKDRCLETVRPFTQKRAPCLCIVLSRL